MKEEDEEEDDDDDGMSVLISRLKIGYASDGRSTRCVSVCVCLCVCRQGSKMPAVSLKPAIRRLIFLGAPVTSVAFPCACLEIGRSIGRM